MARETVVIGRSSGVGRGADLNIFGYGTVTSDDPVTVGANMALCDGAWLTHTANAAAENYKINYTIRGNLAIYLGAMVNADSRGYSSGAPGSGSYGGQRGQGIGNTYGSVVAPTNLGSVGLLSQPGGGAICFNVSGATVLDGTLSANGGASGDHNGSGASGGSVWITSGTLSGDRASPWALEPLPNGGRINLGAYGNTIYASKTLQGGTVVVLR